MPYALYLGVVHSSTSTKRVAVTLNACQKFVRWLLCLAAIGTSYGPYMLFIDQNSIYEAMLLTTLVPLSSIVYIVNAYFETTLYRHLGLSSFKSDKL